ncbi:uncharacterized protein [Rutidosis leptorrhynchoides]|uniref:uncharacterized protein n=1 Tax=Rutidosis leptorrhynchoides TaxID=125765 RepID=UPI003A9A3AFE
MLVYSKLAPSLWAEAVNTACFTQNHSIINCQFDKTPYELLFDRRPKVKYFRIFRCVCYVLNDEDNLGKFDVRGDEVIFIGYLQDFVAYRFYNCRTRIIKESTNVKFYKISGMILGHNGSQPGLSTTINFDSYITINFSTSPCAENDSSEFLLLDELDIGLSSTNITHVVTSQIPIVKTYPLEADETSPSSGTNTPVSDETTPSVFPNDQNVEIHVPLWEENDTYPTVNTEPTGSSSSSYVDTSLDNETNPPLPHTTKWTIDHPIYQIIGDLDAPVRTQSASNNECLFAAFLSKVEPKSAHEALQDPDWSIAMQEEIHQFDHLEVWELVPRPPSKTLIDTKWIFKNKKDTHDIVIRNKARLVAKGYR